jgi:hypothetical protein
MHHEEIAVHVETLPTRQVVLLVEVQLAHQPGITDRPDVKTGLPGPDREVDIVVEDEEGGIGEPDPVHDAPPNHEPLEGDVRQLDAFGQLGAR